MHGVPHTFIGGQMISYESIFDPMFLGHHSMIENTFTMWQDCKNLEIRSTLKVSLAYPATIPRPCTNHQCQYLAHSHASARITQDLTNRSDENGQLIDFSDESIGNWSQEEYAKETKGILKHRMLDQSDWRGRLAHQPWNKHITARYDRINNFGYTGAPAKSATVHITVRTLGRCAVRASPYGSSSSPQP